MPDSPDTCGRKYEYGEKKPVRIPKHPDTCGPGPECRTDITPKKVARKPALKRLWRLQREERYKTTGLTSKNNRSTRALCIADWFLCLLYKQSQMIKFKILCRIKTLIGIFHFPI